MAKPPFPIPKPWQSGLAIPGYMQNEGLREGAFVTHPTPRGTYDAPNPFDPSWDKTYAVPDYILSEGYGQGARVTHWPARGTYVGATKGQAKKATLKALGDVDSPALPRAYARYGQRAARAIMLRLQAVAPDKRRAELKRLMDAIDPSLWSRTETGANKLVARGVPAPKAIEAALARAMGSGVAAEILELGSSKSLPKARSLLGLGCYGCAGVVAALGDTAALKAKALLSAAPAKLAIAQPAGPGAICSADGQFVWVNDHWERIRAGQTCASHVSSGSGPTVRDHTGGGGGGVTVTDSSGQVVKTPVTTPTSTSIDLLRVGPWLLRNKSDERISISKAMLTPEQRSVLLKGIAMVAAKSVAFGTGGNPAGWPTLKSLGWDADTKVPGFMLDDFFPIAKFVHPETGKKCAIYARLIGTKDAPQVQLMWDEWRSAWAKIIGFLVDLVAAIVKPILEELGNLACQLVNDPSVAAGTTVAAGAAATAGGGPAAGGAAASGVTIAQNLCGGGAPPPPPAEESSFPILPVAIAGGAVLAIAAFWPRKKRT